jgi:hypothetical protein
VYACLFFVFCLYFVIFSNVICSDERTRPRLEKSSIVFICCCVLPLTHCSKFPVSMLIDLPVQKKYIYFFPNINQLIFDVVLLLGFVLLCLFPVIVCICNLIFCRHVDNWSNGNVDILFNFLYNF